jgi:hypothetical protein
MVDKYFLVIEIPLAVIAPRPAENLFNIRVAALLLAHLLTEMCSEKEFVSSDERGANAVKRRRREDLSWVKKILCEVQLLEWLE